MPARSIPDGVIDIHIHVTPWEMVHPPILAQLESAHDGFAAFKSIPENPTALIDLMDQAGIARVGIVNYVAPEIMGFDFSVNRFAADYIRDHRDRMFAYGSIDPHNSKDPDGELAQILDEWGLAAIKIHPPHQAVAPNAYLEGNTILPKIYEGCARRGVPVTFHTGTTIFKGARIKYGNPLAIDDVAVDFPDLTIVIAHLGRPLWYETARYLLRRHPNIYADISSIPPKKLPEVFPDLPRFADRVMWGTDWPGPGVPTLDANIIRENALRVFAR